MITVISYQELGRKLLVSGPISTRKLIGMPGDPESLSSSLAHVVASREGEDVILGQAWLAGPGMLVTCGHVVEEFKRSPVGMTIKFPLSGNRYVCRDIRLHPNYGQKGKEQLIRFDLAVIYVDLMPPDVNAPLLPITFDKYEYIPAQQSLSAIRYPSHLGQLTTSQFPLAQVGRYLGLLKKSDRFHLLHDLALAPGDSGSPIFDGDSVIAIHCGDTATLPGLNLPTTSIRLAVSIDALRALDISETKPMAEPNKFYALGPGLCMFLITFVISFVLVGYLVLSPVSSQWPIRNSELGNVDVSFDKPLDKYVVDDNFAITVKPEKDCFLYVFYTEDETALILYPAPGLEKEAELKAGSVRPVEGFGKYKLKVDEREVGNIHIFVLKNNQPVVTKDEMEKVNPEDCRLPINVSALKERLDTMFLDRNNECIHAVFDAPQARMPGGSKRDDKDKQEETESDKVELETGQEGEPGSSSTESGPAGETESDSETRVAPGTDTNTDAETIEEAAGRREKVIDKLTGPESGGGPNRQDNHEKMESESTGSSEEL